MPRTKRLLATIAVAATAAGLGAVALVGGSATSGSADETCPDVDVVFARGSGEPAGPGEVGQAFVTALTDDIGAQDVAVHPVAYPADWDQRSVAPGALDLVGHVRTRAAECPDTRFVLGGFSQGASVVSYALNAFAHLDDADGGAVLPEELAPRVEAVVVFGNPLGLVRRDLEHTSSSLSDRSRSYCADGDLVCGGGRSTAAHRTYVSAGYTARAAAFAATQLG